MIVDHKKHILLQDQQARTALRVLDELPDHASRTLFITDSKGKMVGSLTDGDIRRGLLHDLEISQDISNFMNKSFKYINIESNLKDIKEFRKNGFNLLPVLDENGYIKQVLDLKKTRTMLPLTALIMAGGRGERLRPFTDNTPKPMLMVGNKPIIEHNIDRLIQYGITDIYISVNYLKQHIIDYFGDGSSKGVNIKYISEDKPLGTLGAITLIEKINSDDILVMNSDLLTNIDFEDFYQFYKSQKVNMAVASIPYTVNIPYAVLDTKQHIVTSFVEKPTYTYYSNGGIYIIKSALQNAIKSNSFYNATDLMDLIIAENDQKLLHYPLLCYWLDIGKHQDYIKAQEDIKHINF